MTSGKARHVPEVDRGLLKIHLFLTSHPTDSSRQDTTRLAAFLPPSQWVVPVTLALRGHLERFAE